MRPTLIVNPVTDRAFGAFAEQQLDDRATITQFQIRLRVRYPLATVHARELSGERIIIWYVYRDGRWTNSRGPDS